MDTTRALTIAIYDEHQLLRELLHHQLERLRFEVLFSCKSEEELMRYIGYNLPNLLLVNAEYLQAQRNIFLSHMLKKTQLKRIVFYNCNASEILSDAPQVKKDLTLYYLSGGYRNLISLIDDINKHPVPVLQESIHSLRLLPDNPFYKIAANEKYIRILGMLKDGMAVKQIAHMMQSTEHTINTYIKKMHEETGYNNSIQLVYKAREYGVI